MSDTVMVTVGVLGWLVVGALVWWVDRRAKARSEEEIVRHATSRANDVMHHGEADTRIEKLEARIVESERDVDRMVTKRLEALGALISDLNIRVARAEATIAATPTPPDPATIITAATAPLLALTEQYTAPHQFPVPSVPQPTAADGEWSAEELAAYDPFDAEFPEIRAADDYSPPAGFGGLGIDLPRLDG